LDKKKEIYELLIIDLLLELSVSLINIYISNYMSIFGVSDINNIFNTNSVNFNNIFKNILDKIDDGINLINTHNEKINSLNS
jgi:hypothetical protein